MFIGTSDLSKFKIFLVGLLIMAPTGYYVGYYVGSHHKTFKSVLRHTQQNEIEVTVLEVHDGDTIKIYVPNWPEIFSTILVRVNGIDTPELMDQRPEIQVLALKAKAETTKLLTDHKITITKIKRDKYFRLLATVKYDGIDLADTLVSEGLAKKYNGRGPKPW